MFHYNVNIDDFRWKFRHADTHFHPFGLAENTLSLAGGTWRCLE